MDPIYDTEITNFVLLFCVMIQANGNDYKSHSIPDKEPNASATSGLGFTLSSRHFPSTERIPNALAQALRNRVEGRRKRDFRYARQDRSRANES